MNRRLARTRAFTLLEVILALGLTVIVLSVVGMAIHLHLRSVDHARVGIERDQLARTLLRRIADDVRSAIRREPFDDSGLQAMMGKGVQDAAKSMVSGDTGGKSSSSGSSADSGSSSNAGGQSSGKKGAGKSGKTGSAGKAGAAGKAQQLGSDSSSEDTSAATEAPSAIPGLYGTAYDLQIDIGRIPRPDELSAAATSGASVPSDVKTVYYYVANASSGLSVNGETGLMRSEMNRAAALFASENGQTDSFLRNAEPLASEVMSMEFRYFDGVEWLSEWSSQEMNGLPLAIEIALVLVDPASADAAVAGGSLFDATLSGVDPELIYHTVVQLPNGQLPQSSTSASGDTSSDQGPTDVGSGSSSGASGGNTQSK